jgi:lysophospholipase L1-like esterase
MSDSIPLKTALTMILAVAILWAMPHVPGLRRFGGFQPGAEAWTLLRFPPLVTASKPVEAPVKPKPAPLPSPDPPFGEGFDPAMRHFEQALSRTDQKLPGAVTRVLHYGDSPVTADLITAELRSQLQARFGDAGHGFLLIAKPWAWYGHRGMELKGDGWKIEAATQSRSSDGFHGLGGVSFRGGKGASSEVRFLSGVQTAVEVQYLEQPGGGSFQLSADKQAVGVVETDGPVKRPGYAQFALPEGTREVSLEVKSGVVRAFGYNFTKPGPGIVYSSLGLNGAQVQAVLRYFQPDQWAEELRHENPDLVVVNYGTNESVYPDYIEKGYAGELRKVIERIRTAVPNASVLIMSPMDRGERDDKGEIGTPPVLPRIVEIQKQVAKETGCAFFDTFDAMGGAGTMGRWYKAQPRLVSGDFIHPFPAGAAKVGGLVDEALLAGYHHGEGR